jgi:hypothetical protein
MEPSRAPYPINPRMGIKQLSGDMIMEMKVEKALVFSFDDEYQVTYYMEDGSFSILGESENDWFKNLASLKKDYPGYARKIGIYLSHNLESNPFNKKG